MKVSYKWLKQYVAIPDDVTAEQIAAKLTVATVEIEGVENQAEAFANMVVGEILEVVKHPDADRLTVCRVNIGQVEPVQIVCGAANVKVGLKTAVALPGAKVRWHGQGELVALEKTKVRGVESFGMMCGPDEIGLAGEGYSNEGIVELAEGLAGENLAQVLEFDDSVIEIDNKSITNRPDLWGHYGVAREISALFGWKLFPLPESTLPENATAQEKLSVTIEKPDMCSRYSAVVVDGLEHVKSPRWMRRLLVAVGLRSISAIVDVTNFVMLELGQPMHAFSREAVSGKDILVKYNAGEFVTLDGELRKIDDQVLMIADKTKSLAIAGIMGGQSSQITEATKKVILESATFDPVGIRRSSVRLGLRTDASARFEKSLDPEMTMVALSRALSLIKTIFPEAKLGSQIVDKYVTKAKKIVVEVSTDFIRNRIGKNITNQEMVTILESLSFEVKQKKDQLKISVPSFRATKDISIAEDIVDEISRIYGFANIEEKEPMVAMTSKPAASYEFELMQKVKSILARICGMSEVMTYSFAAKRTMDIAGLPLEKRLSIVNYPNDDCRYLRLSLVENLLVTVENNLRFYSEQSIFEVGRVYSLGEGEWAMDASGQKHLPKQPLHVAGVNVAVKNDDLLFVAKGQIKVLLEQLGAQAEWEVANNNDLPFLKSNRYLTIKVSDQVIGWLAEAKTELINKLADNKTIVAWEIDLSLLKKYVGSRKLYKPTPKFLALLLI
jgi:phenylalanyl-tRNA synthetase beta chain